jgi:hypothetical protein
MIEETQKTNQQSLQKKMLQQLLGNQFQT